MKRILYILLFLYSYSILAGSDGYKRNPSVDVTHYEFSVSVSDSNNLIIGHAVISVSYSSPVKTLSFDLRNINAEGKGMKILDLEYDKGAVQWVHSGDKIVITLNDQALAGTGGEFTIDYSGIPADGLIISDNKFGERTFFADNWPDRAHNWLPCVDHPSDKATVDFLVSAPEHYEVVGSGYLVEESCLPGHTRLTHWREEVPLATEVMAIGLAPFASKLESRIDGIPVWTWVYARNRKEGFADYSVAVKPLAFYSKLIGPYPYEKLANVQSKTIFGGLENAGCIFYAENSVTGQGKAESLMAHEIAHQWFGNSVTESDWHHIWLSEGFATYLTALYLENTYGKEKLNETMKTARARVLSFSLRLHAPVVDTTVTDLMRLLNTNSYQKGAWVLHMLRREVGDDKFFEGLQNFYSTFRDKNALTSDFRAVMEKTSGRSLDRFFHQWLFTAGQPDLEFKTVPGSEKGTTELIIEQKQDPLFSFTIDVNVKDEKGLQRLKIAVTDRITRTVLHDKQVLELDPDPDINLLFSYDSSTGPVSK
jgi:aminopeptidase N